MNFESPLFVFDDPHYQADLQDWQQVWPDVVEDVRRFKREGKSLRSLLYHKNPSKLWKYADAFQDFALHACKCRPAIIRIGLSSHRTTKGYGSWLIRTGMNPARFAIGLDFGRIYEGDGSRRRKIAPRNGKPEKRTNKEEERRHEAKYRAGFRAARLILHEIGHIKYHAQHAGSGEVTLIAGQPLARTCKPCHEAVAWTYSMLVAGFILAQASHDVRVHDNGPDNVWECL